jgi:hypothetical protein
MTDTVIIRRKVKRDFTALSNDLIRDQRLSWGGLGLLVYILHLPDNFRLRLSHLSRQKASGRDATRARVKELEAFGYLAITRERGSRGRFASTSWEITDEPSGLPQDIEPPRSGNPTTVNPTADKPGTEKPTLLKTNTEQVLNIKNTTTTTLSESTTNRPSELLLPTRLPLHDAQAISNALRDIPLEDAQNLVDELSAAIESPGAIRTTPARWFYGLLKKYRQGEFNPYGAAKVAMRRTKATQENETPKAPASSPDFALAQLANIHEMLKSKRRSS